MIFKLIILAFLAFGSVVYGQHGKSDQSSKESKKNRPNEIDNSQTKQKNNQEPNSKNRTDFGSQSPKEKQGNQDSKRDAASNDQKPRKGGKGDDAFQQKNHKSKNQPQHNQEKGDKPHKLEKPHHDKHPKGHGGKPVKMKGNKGYDGKPHKFKHSKRHPNFGYLYMNTSGVFSKHNYGYWRSREAKNKHKNYHPKYEYLAVEGFNLIIVRNNFLFNETKNKIRLVRSLLYKKRKAGKISDAEYDNTIRTVVLLEKRRAGLEINLFL